MLGKRGLIRGIISKNSRGMIAAGAMAALLMVSGASAFFTDTDSATNTWTVGSVNLDLIETAYDNAPEERQNITPNKVLTKDPVVKNTGSNDAFVFIKFSVPKANVKTVSDDGTVLNSNLQELFSYTIDSQWTQVSKVESDKANTYVYAYGTSADCTKLNPNVSTSVIFKNSQIKFKNIIEGQGLENTTLEVPVEAFAIQTTDITSNGKTDPSSVWKVLSGQVSQ